MGDIEYRRVPVGFATDVKAVHLRTNRFQLEKLQRYLDTDLSHSPIEWIDDFHISLPLYYHGLDGAVQRNDSPVIRLTVGPDASRYFFMDVRVNGRPVYREVLPPHGAGSVNGDGYAPLRVGPAKYHPPQTHHPQSLYMIPAGFNEAVACPIVMKSKNHCTLELSEVPEWAKYLMVPLLETVPTYAPVDVPSVDAFVGKQLETMSAFLPMIAAYVPEEMHAQMSKKVQELHETWERVKAHTL